MIDLPQAYPTQNARLLIPSVVPASCVAAAHTRSTGASSQSSVTRSAHLKGCCVCPDKPMPEKLPNRGSRLLRYCLRVETASCCTPSPKFRGPSRAGPDEVSCLFHRPRDPTSQLCEMWP